jgi:hypothetical protein
MSILAAVGHPSTVIDTDYESTTALYTGHLTANTPFTFASLENCHLPAVRRALHADHAGFLLIGTVNKPHLIDNACLFHLAASHPFAVRLLRTQRDQASVFELIGPGTAHPTLTDLVGHASQASNAPISLVRRPSLGRGDVPGYSTVITPSNGQGQLTWTWGDHDSVTQVSVGEVQPLGGGTISGVTIEVQRANGTWVPVDDSAGPVGDGGASYLLGELPAGTKASAMRLVVHATGPVAVTDAHALGTPVGSNASQ